ncbi:MAG: sulfatase-like hydrolase/transferase [Candidatus Solibacter usitatus]|nr:sulfatase-like hydrolase/transferase [Candidatus Solibacter usitatus]
MITRRSAIQALTGAAAAPGILKARRTPGDKPNLLFLWTDQQRADTMAAYGNTRFHVPNMNRLASESVVFERAYIAQPVCTPSRSCMMTGTWPHTNGCIHNNIRLSAEAKTLPEILNDSHYRTGYFGKWHLGDEVFAQRGFEEWAAIEDGIYQQYYSAGRDPNARSAYHHFLIRQGYTPDTKNGFSRRIVTKLPVEHSKPSFLAQEASSFIMKHRAEPWMLYVNFLEPHTPFGSALDMLHTEEEARLPDNFEKTPENEPEWYIEKRKGFHRAKTDGFDMTQRKGWQEASRNYAGLCSLVDQALGRILWTLEASGMAENTIVVYTSDHGEMMGSHGLLTKQVMYQEATHVPYLIRAPFRKQKPMRVARPVSHIDTVPTMLELLGRKDAIGQQGESLVGAITGQRRESDVIIEWNREGPDQGPSARTVVTPDGWKLVQHDTDKALLFHLAKDPLELKNLYGKPEVAAKQKELRGKITAFQKKTNDKLQLPGA